VGGHCTPVYPHFLINAAKRRGLRQQLATAGRRINTEQPRRQIERLVTALGAVDACRVHILGLAFRPQVREDAYSPAISLRDNLLELGASVTIEDPLYADADLASKGFMPGRVDDNVD